jgi:hypothetical protein
MINEHAVGHIVDIDEGGTATIKAVLPNLYRALDRKYNEVEIILPDGRRITAKQRRKVYSILAEISDYINGQHESADVEETKEIMKWDFALARMEGQERRLFSLSNVDETTARNFIDYLIEFCVKNNVPMKISPLEYCEDISKYVYACMINKRCCICGKPADLHHVDAIGMGNDRTEVIHIGRDALPLCRDHHVRLHEKGNKYFIETYHLQPVKIDKKIAKLYKLNTKETKNHE